MCDMNYSHPFVLSFCIDLLLVVVSECMCRCASSALCLLSLVMVNQAIHFIVGLAHHPWHFVFHWCVNFCPFRVIMINSIMTKDTLGIFTWCHCHLSFLFTGSNRMWDEMHLVSADHIQTEHIVVLWKSIAVLIMVGVPLLGHAVSLQASQNFIIHVRRTAFNKRMERKGAPLFASEAQRLFLLQVVPRFVHHAKHHVCADMVQLSVHSPGQ